MENRNPFAPAPRSTESEDVTTWSLPEGAIARLGRGRSNDMAFSPDGQYFAVDTSIGLWLYELSTLLPIVLWDAERGMTGGVTFSPDSRKVVTHPFAENVKVWDVQSGTCVAEMSGLDNQDICRPVFSQDGQHLVAADYRMENRKIYVWCSHTGTKISETEIQHPFNVYPLCFSPDLNLLVGKNSDPDHIGRNIGDGDSITVWQVETGEQIANITGYSERVRQFCFSSCGRFLAAGDWHGTIHVWDVTCGQLEMIYTDYDESHMYPYFLPEGELITAAVSERKVEIWHVEKGEKLDEFEHRGNSQRACFSESGKQLAVASPSEIQIWTKGNNANSHTLSTLHGHIPTMDTLAFSSDEKTLAAGLWRDNVLLWDIASKRSYRPHGEKLPGTYHNVYRAPSGKIISISISGNNLNLWEVGKRESIAELSPTKAGLRRAEACASTGDRIAGADRDDNIHIWIRTSTLNDIEKSESWKKHTTLVDHADFINGLVYCPKGLAFSPDGKQLASISRDRTAHLWDVDAGKQIAELPLSIPDRQKGYYRFQDMGIAFSPRGDIIAGGQWSEIVLWDATDGKILMTLPQPEGSQRPITLCFSPCGQYLASGAWWQPGLQKVPIRLWEVDTGENIATFWGHTTDVQCFAFSQDGTLLVSGGHDGAIYLWDLRPYL